MTKPKSFLESKKPKYLAFLAFLFIFATFHQLHSLDAHNFGLRRLVPKSGGTLKHAPNNRGWFANVLPYGRYTKWMRPVIEVDLTDADIDDETVRWVVHNGAYLERLILDGNPNVSNKSVKQLNKLQNLKELSTNGTKISQPIVADPSAFNSEHYTPYLFSLVFLSGVTGMFFQVLVEDEADLQ